MRLSAILFLYLVAAILPAYFLARRGRNIWRNLLAYLAGLFVELVVVFVAVLFEVSLNSDAAPILVMMAFTPRIPFMLLAPCVGIAVAQTQQYIERFIRPVR